MIYLLSFAEQIDKWDKQLNDLADQLFDNPFSGMVVFMVLLVISIIAVRGYAKK